MTTTNNARSPLWFIAPLLVVYAVAFYIVAMLPHVESPALIAAGLTVDLVVIVPALYYFVFIRGRGWPVFTVVPVLLLSYGAASWIIPSEYHLLLSVVGFVAPLAEIGVMGFIGYKAWRIIRERRSLPQSVDDHYDRIRHIIKGAFDVPAAAAAIAYEAGLFYYAFAFRSARGESTGFSSHRRSGYGGIYVALLMAAAAELTAVHFLLQAWSPTAAWIHLGISLYTVIWLTGDYRAIRQRRIQLDDDGLRLRCGIRWDVRVLWTEVEAVRRDRHPEKDKDYLNLAPIGEPAYVIELARPVQATGPYGLQRDVKRIGVVIDQKEEFEERLREVGKEIEGSR